MNGYYISNEYRLIIQYHKGTLTIHDLLTVKQDLLNSKDFNAHYSFLIYTEDIDLKIVENDMFSFVKQAYWLKYFKYKNIPIIANDPKTVALATLFQDVARKYCVNYRVFSTLDAAMLFAGKQYYIFSIQEKLRKLLSVPGSGVEKVSHAGKKNMFEHNTMPCS